MELGANKLSLWGIYTVLLLAVNLIIFQICNWNEHMLSDPITYAFVTPFAALQAFLLTRDRRIWHIIMPLTLSLILVSVHLFDHTPEGYEFTALMIEGFAPPLYCLMQLLFTYYGSMSFPVQAYLLTSGILMSVGLFSYKILIYWCVVRFAKYLRSLHSRMFSVTH